MKSGKLQAESPVPVRYEFEDGTLLGKAYTYDSYCPASGGNKEGHDLVGGMEKPGDGVEIQLKVPQEGDYTLDIIYGKANDGAPDENGRLNSDDRADARVKLTVDVQEEEISLPNTIKSEYTSCYTVQKHLHKGNCTVRLEHAVGTYVLDSLVLTPVQETDEIALLYDADRSTKTETAYLAVAPQDGYYLLSSDTQGMHFLKRGLNYLSVPADGEAQPLSVRKTEEEITFMPAGDWTLRDGAVLGEQNGEAYLDGISCKGGKALLAFDAPEAGEYALTLQYSNNEEGGVHDYNVDLIERYVTLRVNGKKLQNIYCRNTYSWTSKNTVTVTVPLQQGKNVLVLSNDGAVKFRGRDTFAPHIFGVSLNPVNAFAGQRQS